MTIEELKAENARLKAEVERLTAENASVKLGNAELRQMVIERGETAVEDIRVICRLEAEVERLSQPAIIGGYNLSQYIRMANSETLEFDNGDIFADMTLPERIKYIVESHARLKAEVERLTKAGDAMASSIQFNEEMSQDYNGPTIVHQSVQRWNAAKEGKQP
jgi:regulator of replication initiation timing